jgi:hypothetical protein
MSEWSRGALMLLLAYALFQTLLWIVLPAAGPQPNPLSPTITPGTPQRGSPASICASVAFAEEGHTSRLSLYDTAPLIIGTGLSQRTPHNGEEVWRQLSLLRESLRDGWVHFAGDQSHKQSWYQWVSLLQKQGPEAAESVPPKEAAKRLASKDAAKAELKLGSTRLSFAYRPLLADLSKDWSGTVFKADSPPPQIVVYSAGIWDVINHTENPQAKIEALFKSIVSTMSEKLSLQMRVPTVLFLASPRLAESASATLSAETKAQVEAEMELMKTLQLAVQQAASEIARIEGDVVEAQASTSSQGIAGARAVHPRILFLETNALNQGHAPFVDTDVPLLLNPTNLAVSLASFTGCHLGQHPWAIRAFTPGQITLFLFWVAIVLFWAMGSLKNQFPSLVGASKGGRYHRVDVEVPSAEIELAEGGGHGGVNGSTANGNHAVASTHPAASSTGPSSPTPAAAGSLHPWTVLVNYIASPAFHTLSASLVQLGCILLVMFLCDGNHRWTYLIAGDKLYVRDTFLFVLLVLAGFAWRSIGPNGGPNPESLLNRDQTEEWKGVMQLLFVLYHFFAAKEMYNLIRIFIAAYVWLTGYNNFSFFVAKGDYSITRLTKMLFRLNFFVSLVCVAMNR